MAIVEDFACTLCSCVCDDLRLTVEGDRIVRAERACTLAEPWLLSQDSRQPPVARIDGQSVELQAAVGRAADLLSRARYPLIFGLSQSSTDGQRAAVRLAETIGATIDTTASRGHGPSIMAVQQAGESTCSLGEVKNRCDLVLFLGLQSDRVAPATFGTLLGRLRGPVRAGRTKRPHTCRGRRDGNGDKPASRRADQGRAGWRFRVVVGLACFASRPGIGRGDLWRCAPS